MSSSAPINDFEYHTNIYYILSTPKSEEKESIKMRQSEEKELDFPAQKSFFKLPRDLRLLA